MEKTLLSYNMFSVEITDKNVAKLISEILSKHETEKERFFAAYALSKKLPNYVAFFKRGE